MDKAELNIILDPDVVTAVQQICKPLFYRTPINGFQLIRVYRDGSRIHLGSDPAWTKLFYAQKLYNASTLNPHFPGLQSGAYIWDHWPKDGAGYLECGKIAEDDFNHGHGLTICKAQENYCDIVDISLPKNAFRSDDFYQSNLDLLDKFVNYFIDDAAKEIMVKADAHKFKLENQKVKNPHDQFSHVAQGLMKKQYANILQNHNDYAKLTRSEKRILSWLFQGKTATEIAMTIHRSPRTIEKYIPLIKEKLNCQTLFQIGAKLSPFQYRIMLEEFIGSLRAI